MRLSIKMTNYLATATAAMALTLGGVGQSRAAFIRVGELPAFGNDAVQTIFSSGDLSGAATTMTVADFNSSSVATLRSQFDVLYVNWESGAAANLDWTTRILPFLNLGGGVIFEDPSSVSQLAPAIVGHEADDGAGGLAFTTTVPGLTNGITPSSFVNTHTAFSSWSSAFTPFMVDNSNGGATVGLYSTAFGGHFVGTGPDQNFHSVRGDNQYQFEINEIQFAASGAPLVSAPAPSGIVLLGLGAVGLMGYAGLRRKRARMTVRGVTG